MKYASLMSYRNTDRYTLNKGLQPQFNLDRLSRPLVVAVGLALLLLWVLVSNLNISTPTFADPRLASSSSVSNMFNSDTFNVGGDSQSTAKDAHNKPPQASPVASSVNEPATTLAALPDEQSTPPSTQPPTSPVPGMGGGGDTPAPESPETPTAPTLGLPTAPQPPNPSTPDTGNPCDCVQKTTDKLAGTATSTVTSLL
jgi:hypothetical protein